MFSCLKKFAKTIDTDKLSEDISKNAQGITQMGIKAGVVNANQASKVSTGLQAGAKQIDAFGDKHPEYFGKKPQQAGNPNAAVGQQGAQADPSAPHLAQSGVPAPDNAPQAYFNQEAKGPVGQDAPPAAAIPATAGGVPHADPGHAPSSGTPPQFNSPPPPAPRIAASAV